MTLEEHRRQEEYCPVRTQPEAIRFVSQLTRGTFALALAGGRGSRLQQLTDWRCKPAVPFGGKFRIVDFTLSNYILAGGAIPCGFGQQLAQDSLTTITLDDRELGGALVLTASAPAALRARPHFTMSQSEAGFERIMQAATVTLSSGRLAPALRALTLKLEVAVTPGS